MESKINLPADLLWVNNTTHTEHFWIKEHIHGTYYHLTYIEEGTCNIIVNNEIYEMTPTMVALAAPNDPHGFHSVTSKEGIRFWEVKFIVYSNSLNHALSKLPKVFITDDLQRGLLNQVIKSGYNTGGHANVNAGRFYLTSFLYYLCDEVMSASNQDCPSPYLQGIDISNFSKATIDTVLYMEENYMHEVTLEKIGAEIGYHKNYISTMVRKDLSIHANELLSFIRIQKAAALLTQSDYSLTEIYLQTGFKNNSHFSKLFKKMVGLSPAQYRRSYPDGIIAPAEDGGFDEAIPMWGKGLLRDYIESKLN